MNSEITQETLACGEQTHFSAFVSPAEKIGGENKVLSAECGKGGEWKMCRKFQLKNSNE